MLLLLLRRRMLYAVSCMCLRERAQEHHRQQSHHQQQQQQQQAESRATSKTLYFIPLRIHDEKQKNMHTYQLIRKFHFIIILFLIAPFLHRI